MASCLGKQIQINRIWYMTASCTVWFMLVQIEESRDGWEQLRLWGHWVQAVSHTYCAACLECRRKPGLTWAFASSRRSPGDPRSSPEMALNQEAAALWGSLWRAAWEYMGYVWLATFSPWGFILLDQNVELLAYMRSNHRIWLGVNEIGQGSLLWCIDGWNKKWPATSAKEKGFWPYLSFSPGSGWFSRSDRQWWEIQLARLNTRIQRDGEGRPTQGQRAEGLMDVRQTWQMLTF